MKKILKQQRGVTFGGFIQVLVIFAVLAVFAMKLIPVYMDNGKIQKSFEVIVNDPAMQAASVREIKDSFSKRAIVMDNVTNITDNDIEISKDGGRLTLSASYEKKIPLAGNVSLVITFNPSASR
jgi:hypothetical protein